LPFPRQTHGLGAVFGLGHDLDVAGRFAHVPHPLAEEAVVIGEEETDGGH